MSCACSMPLPTRSSKYLASHVASPAAPFAAAGATAPVHNSNVLKSINLRIANLRSFRNRSGESAGSLRQADRFPADVQVLLDQPLSPFCKAQHGSTSGRGLTTSGRCTELYEVASERQRRPT